MKAVRIELGSIEHSNEIHFIGRKDGIFRARVLKYDQVRDMSLESIVEVGLQMLRMDHEHYGEVTE